MWSTGKAATIHWEDRFLIKRYGTPVFGMNKEFFSIFLRLKANERLQQVGPGLSTWHVLWLRQFGGMIWQH